MPQTIYFLDNFIRAKKASKFKFSFKRLKIKRIGAAAGADPQTFSLEYTFIFWAPNCQKLLDE